MSEIKMDVSKKTADIFNKIAQWHNGDIETPSSSNLKILAHEIVEDLINFAVEELGAKTKMGVEADQDALRNNLAKDIQKNQKPKSGGIFSIFK